MQRRYLNYLMIPSISIAILTGCNSNMGNTAPDNSGITAVNMQTKSSNPNNNNIKPLGDDFYPLQMGVGFDKTTNTATSDQSCLAAAGTQAALESNVSIINPQGYISFSDNEDFSTLLSELNLSTSVSGGGWMFSGSVAAQFAQQAKDTDYTLNLVFLDDFHGTAEFNQGSLGQGESALTPMAAYYNENMPKYFAELCGKEYVSDMNAGGVLSVVLSLSFDSQYEKEQFKSALNGQIAGLASVTAALEYAEAQTNANVDFSISAFQEGGEPEQLSNIFGTESSDGNYPFVDCGNINGGPNMQACNEVIDNIISYGQQFESQLYANGQLNLNNLYYSNPATTSYKRLGIDMHGVPNPSESVLEAMYTISHDLTQISKDDAFANHYITALGPQLSIGTALDLNSTANKLNNQLNSVLLNPAYQAIECYRGYVSANCVSIANNINTGLSHYALNGIESMELAYLEGNSYLSILYTYNGSIYTPMECVLAPVSSPDSNHYVIECNDSILPLTNGNLTIQSGEGAESGEIITGLAYTSDNQNIVYESGTGINLQPAKFYPGDFNSDDNITVDGNNNVITHTGIVKIDRQPKSQA